MLSPFSIQSKGSTYILSPILFFLVYLAFVLRQGLLTAQSVLELTILVLQPLGSKSHSV